MRVRGLVLGVMVAAGCAVASPRPQALADCVDGVAYGEDLAFIADIRTPGTPHWQAVQDLCADRLAEAGYEVVLQDYGTGINVVGRRLGASKPNEVIVVGAHYDHIADCHGADDNASGVAATLEIGRLLARAEFDRTIIVAAPLRPRVVLASHRRVPQRPLPLHEEPRRGRRPRPRLRGRRDKGDRRGRRRHARDAVAQDGGRRAGG